MTIKIARPRPSQVRLKKIRRWVARQLGSTRHEHRVLQIATAIFDLTARFHGLSAGHRRLLKLGSLLHDVGRSRGDGKHHVRGARMVMESRALRLPEADRKVVAHLVRYHRGGSLTCDKSLCGKQGGCRTIRLLLAMLRVADSLDSRRMEIPAVMIRLKGRDLRIRSYVTDVDKAWDVFHPRKKLELLEKLLGIRIEVQWRQADPASLIW